MAERITFRDDWLNFGKRTAKAKGRQRGTPNLIWIGLPGNSANFKLVWFSDDETGHYLACLLTATLYCIKDKWESFLKKHLKRRSQNVIVLCEDLEHAKPGPKSDWDFAEVPVAFRSSWPHPVVKGKRSESVFLVDLILGEAQGTNTPHYLALCALAWLNKALLENVGSVRHPDTVIDSFWTAVENDVEKMCELFY